MDVTLLKAPYEISFSGNPLLFSFQLSPYGDNERKQDVSLVVRVFIENIFNSGIFEEVYLQTFFPTDDGRIEFDVSGIVGPYLDYYTPRTDLNKPVEAVGQRKRYKLSYTLQSASTQSTSFYPDLPLMFPLNDGFHVSSILTAVKGGLAFEAWHYKEFFTKFILEDKKPLLFSAAKEMVDVAALKFLFWIYPLNDAAAQTVTYKVYLSDGTSVTKNNDQTISVGEWGVCCVPAGFNQSGLDAIIPSGKSPVKYSIKIATAGSTIVEEYFFDLDNRNFYDPYYIIYRNSIGGLETIRLIGEVDLAAEYAQQQAQRTVPPAWYNPNLIGMITDEATEETMNYTADTGWMSKEAEMKLRDLLVSKQKMMIDPALNDKLLPIVLNEKTIKFFSNKDALVSASIQWQLAFVNSFYTPGSLMPQTRTCPAVEKFIASQLTKSLLQFMWSLEDPYDQIEVQVIIGDTTNIYTYQGNTGLISQSFINPATTDPVDITIKARTICNPDSVPVDYGAFSTIILSVIANSKPVAVDDYFKMPSGLTVSYDMPVSVLANDFDPDGDPIEAVYASGVTLKGNSYEVFGNGLVRFKTSFSSFTGDDYFDYQIREVGGTDLVTARVHITVGDGPQLVFVKWVLRNISGSRLQTVDGWIDFYSDAACTIPVDITALGLTINAKAVQTNFGNVTGTKNYSVIGTGTKMKLYSGIISYTDPITEIRVAFTVLPGTGYTAVN